MLTCNVSVTLRELKEGGDSSYSSSNLGTSSSL